LTGELPELSTSTKPPELAAAAWPGLAPVVSGYGMLIGAGGALSAIPSADPGGYLYGEDIHLSLPASLGHPGPSG
jgi:hypothetical protein